MALPLFCNPQTCVVSPTHKKQVFLIKTNYRSSYFPTRINPKSTSHTPRLSRISPAKSVSVNGYSIQSTGSNQKDDFLIEGDGKLIQNPRNLIELIRDILPGGNWWRLSTGHVDVRLTAKPVTVVRALQRMWELISEDRWVIFIAFLTLILTALSQITIPNYLTASIFSAQSHNVSVFHRNVRLLMLLCITSGICSGLRGCCFGIANMILVKRMRERLYSTLLLQDISFFDSETVGDLTSRLSADCQQVSRVIGNDLNLISRNLLQGTGAFIYLLILSWPLALCTFVICCALATVMVLYGLYQKKAAKLIQDCGASSNEVAQETLSLMRTVRVYGTEQQELERYKHWSEKVADISLRQSAAYGLWNFSFNTLYHSTQVIAVLIGGAFILTGRITAEQLTKFILYSEWLIYSTWWVGDHLSSLMQSIGASEKVFQLMDLPPSNQFISEGSKLQRLMGHIELLNVSFSYSSRPTVPVLQHINFQVHPNESVAIVGLSGSGKSTLVNLLLRLYEPTSGQIMIDGYPIKDLDIKWFRERVGYVGQIWMY